MLDISYGIKHVTFDVYVKDSSLLEYKVICLSTLKMEAARYSKTFAPTCQVYNAVCQKTDDLSSLQVDEENKSVINF